MKRQLKEEMLVIGAEPRVNLLPPEVLVHRKEKVIRRRLGLGMIGSLVVVALAVGAAVVIDRQVRDELQATGLQTAELLLEQQEYAEVTTVQSHLALATAAQQVGASTEINWKDYLAKVQATLPGSVIIDTVTVDSASPVSLYAQPTAPLQGARMATISFSAKSSVLPDVPAWLTALATLPGFADALPGSVTLDEETGVYTASITMHVNDAALSGRFAPATPEDDVTAETDGTETETAAGDASVGGE